MLLTRSKQNCIPTCVRHTGTWPSTTPPCRQAASRSPRAPLTSAIVRRAGGPVPATPPRAEPQMGFGKPVPASEPLALPRAVPRALRRRHAPPLPVALPGRAPRPRALLCQPTADPDPVPVAIVEPVAGPGPTARCGCPAHARRQGEGTRGGRWQRQGSADLHAHPARWRR